MDEPRFFRGGKFGWGWRYDLARPAVSGIIRDGGGELRWYGITFFQWGIGMFHRVKVRPAIYETRNPESETDG